MARIPADPSEHRGELAAWATLTLLGAAGNGTLLALSALVPRLRANAPLLHLHFAFLVTGLTGASLVLGGDALNSVPAFGPCLFNAAATFASVCMQSGAALTIVAKVWANAMLVYYPTSQLLTWISRSPLLLAIPYIASLPMFFASIGVGLHDRSVVYRSSPFYCTIDTPSLLLAPPLIAAALTLATLVLAGWTATLVARARWRVRLPSGRLRAPRIRNLALVLRVLAFSIFVAVGFICGIVSVAIAFSVTWSDIALSTTGVGAFLIFATDRDILSLVFRLRRAPALSESSHPAGSVSFTKHVHVRRDPPPSTSYGTTRAGSGSSTKLDELEFPPHPAVAVGRKSMARGEEVLQLAPLGYGRGGGVDAVEWEARDEKPPSLTGEEKGDV